MTHTISQYRSDHALWVAEMIHQFGHAIMCVGTGECSVPGCRCGPEPVPWSYTIGLTDDRLPELVVFGLDRECAGNMLNWAAALARDERGIESGEIVELDDELSIRFDAVPSGWVLDPAVDPMGRWWAHYAPGHPEITAPRVLQCVWPDAAGRWPDDPACDAQVVAAQPVGDLLLGPWNGPGACRPNRTERRARTRRRR